MNYFEIETLAKGKRTKKVIKAMTKNDAITIARKTPGVIVKVKQTSAPVEDKAIEFKDKVMDFITSKKVKTPSLVAAVRQLSVMTNAGISIHDSIKEVGGATEDPVLKSIFLKADDDLNSGLSLTESLMPYRDLLGDITISMIELGESTGNMAESLIKLAQIQENIWENQQKFKKAIRYPISVMFAIAGAFTVLMVYVVPKFKEIFEELGADLPLPTKILLACEHALNNYGLYILAGLIAAFFMFKYFYSTNSLFKDRMDAYVFKIYLIGDIVFYANMSRFNLVFTELVRAGIPIAEALDTSLLTISNSNIKKKLGGVRVSVQRGISLTQSFQDTKLYEGMLIQMVSAGEQSGSLDAMLEKVTEYFESKFNDIIDNLSSYIEPIMLACIAGLVIMLALGIFMPMWDMASAVKQ